VQAAGLGLNLAIVIGVVIRHRRRKPARKPE
jgi:ribosomal protein L13E